MVFEVDKFVKSITIEGILELSKANLLDVCKAYKISVRSQMSKSEIRNLLVESLVSNEILEESALESLNFDKTNYLELKKLEMEMKLKEAQMEKEMALKERELSLKEREMELQREERRMSYELQKEKDEREYQLRTESLNDVTKYVKLLPKFNEKEVDKYFLHFEKLLEGLNCPKSRWTILLQSVLLGKAHEAYASLSPTDSSDYEIVKKAILKAYELVPEAYRQKFRNLRKQETDTHVEFAKEKETLFNRWCTSKEVEEDFDKLRQLILIEEFKRCVHPDIKTHLDEQKVKTLEQAAIVSDDYSLTHKGTFTKPNYNRSVPQKDSKKDLDTAANKDQTTSRNTNSNLTNKSDSTSKPNFTSHGPTCAYCKKKGHIIGDCWALKKKNQEKTTSNALAFVYKENGVENLCVQDFIPSLETKVEVKEIYKPFMSKGSVAHEDFARSESVDILRDTGSAQSLMLEDVLPMSEKTFTGLHVIVQGVECGQIKVPLHRIHLNSNLKTGPVTVGICKELPIKGVSFILGNDIAGDKVLPEPVVVEQPTLCDDSERIQEELLNIYPACVVTRSMQKKMEKDESETNLSDTFFTQLNEMSVSKEDEDIKEVVSSRKELIDKQFKDTNLSKLLAKAVSEEESKQLPTCYFYKMGVLMRKWRPADSPVNEEWRQVYQIVVPKPYHKEILSLAHDTAFSGHLGVTKTYNKILNHFYWPGLHNDVVKFCRTCHSCQMVGKPNQKIPVAPLRPIPAFSEPFSRVIIDCVGPLPKSKSGNRFLLTIMCSSTRFPEAIPLRRITSSSITQALVKFFTLVGLPKEVQSDQGSNFMSNLFQQVLYELNIKQCKSSAYHPETQGALERFHQTLKKMMRTYCYENGPDWDIGIPYLLFAVRESTQESLGFSPYELVFGHKVRGPLKLLKEKWLTEEPDINLLDYVSNFKSNFIKACEFARQNLESSQTRMKTWYDKKASRRCFKPGDKVLVLLPLHGQPLEAKYFGPYVIENKINETDYVVQTPGRRKAKRICHINMIKEYHDRIDSEVVETVNCVDIINEPTNDHDLDENYIKTLGPDLKLNNSDVLLDLDAKLSHLPTDQKIDLISLINEFKNIFPDVPSRTDLIYHDVDVNDAKPVKQHPYRMNPIKLNLARKEIDYMLANDIIEPCHSEWSSPCLLVPKPDMSMRFVTDFRKVNALSKSDSFPLPRINDCIDRIGSAKYVNKFDLLKGYWQIPLTDRAKEISSFVTPEGLYCYKVMPFGMKNAPATFQRLVNHLIEDIPNCEAYIDDLVVYGDDWQEFMLTTRKLFEKLAQANLTVNLVKSEFAQATVTYLGHVIGQGEIKPVQSKVDAIVQFPAPTNKKELMRFLGMAGYYRRFCLNFSDVAAPLTNLLKKSEKFRWTESEQLSFDKLKAILIDFPILIAPNFNKQFKLYVDASEVGAGAVLQQDDDNEIEHPICYFSRKFNKHQKNYSTIEKETLALVLALQHFEVYLSTTVMPIVVYTDHNPIVFISKMKNKNQRLLRWSLFLQEHNLEIHHIRGLDNILADGLSRSIK